MTTPHRQASSAEQFGFSWATPPALEPPAIPAPSETPRLPRVADEQAASTTSPDRAPATVPAAPSTSARALAETYIPPFLAGTAFSIHQSLIAKGALDPGTMDIGLIFYDPPETAWISWTDAYPNIRWMIQIDRVDRTGENISLELFVWRGGVGKLGPRRRMTMTPAELSTVLHDGLNPGVFEAQSRP